MTPLTPEEALARALHEGYCSFEDHYVWHQRGCETDGKTYSTPCHPDNVPAILAAIEGYRLVPVTPSEVANLSSTDIAATPSEHEHEWWDADDDETAWHCRGCGLTVPGPGEPVTPSEPDLEDDHYGPSKPWPIDVERLARALATTEVGCWATGARHSAAMDNEQHRRDAERIAAAYEVDR